jgi:hypothetical protein
MGELVDVTEAGVRAVPRGERVLCRELELRRVVLDVYNSGNLLQLGTRRRVRLPEERDEPEPSQQAPPKAP